MKIGKHLAKLETKAEWQYFPNMGRKTNV